YDLNQHAYSARAVAFKRGFLVLLAFQLAGAAKNRALDVLIRHIFVLCRQNCRSQARVGVWFAAADARCDGNFADDPRDSAAALRVGGRFLVLNCRQFLMLGHDTYTFVSLSRYTQRSTIVLYYGCITAQHVRHRS